MPVVSQSRFSTTSSTSLSTGSYRSTLNSSSSLDRPYYSSASGSYVSPRRSAYATNTVTDYRSQLSYDGDGHRARKSSYSSEYSRYSRAPSVAESESAVSRDSSRAAPRPDRSGSRSRDASVARSDSARSSRSDPSPGSFPALSSSDMYKKYSPNFYVPQAQRLSTAVTGPNGDAGRTKLLGDAARLPLPRRISTRNDDERQRTPRGEGLSGLIPRARVQLPRADRRPAHLPLDHSTDDNGNDLQLSVAEIRRKFDSKMAATRLRARQPSALYKTALSSDNIYSQVRHLNNSIYSLIDDKPVPVHKPTSSDKYINDATGSLRWEFFSPSSGYSSDSKGSRETGYTIRHATDPGSDISTIYIAGKMSAERIPLNAVKNQLNANNAMGRILEKSTTVHVGNGDTKASPSVAAKQDRSNEPKNVLNIEIGSSNGQSDDECALKKIATNHTSDFASYIQVSTPISSGAQTNAESSKDANSVSSESPKYTNDYSAKNISCLLSADEYDGTKLRYIDSDPNSENDTRLFVEYNGKDDGEQGFENKTFEHENIHLLRKTADEADIRETEQNGSDEPDFVHTEIRQNGDCGDKHYKVPIKYQNGYGKLTNGTAVEEDDESNHRVEKAKKDEGMSAESKSILEVNGEPAPSLFQHNTNFKESFVPKQFANVSTHDGEKCRTHNGTTSMRYRESQAMNARDSSVSRGSSPLSNATPSSNYGTVTTLTQRKASGAGTEQLSKTSGLNGLRNIGNTCFMNSVVQCLSNTRPLMEYCGNPDQFTPDINTTLSCMKGALIKAFSTVISELWREGESDGVVNTTALKAQIQRFAPRFMGYSQQDAQEFLRYLLEGLHEDVNRVTIKPKPILTEIDDNLSDAQKAQESWNRYLRMEDSRVGDIFVGQLKSSLRCTHCNHTSVTFDPFWDLSLPIPSRTGPLKLTQCLSHFTREEELDGDEKPTCSKCQVRRKCLKWFTIQKFPRVLVLHLKRFSPQERFRGKLNVQVEFPLQGLDLGACSAGSRPHLYSLYAVSNHSGTTYSGHYTAYCKHPYNGEWHEYNDSRVSPISAKNVVSSEAYVLFYEMSDNAGSS